MSVLFLIRITQRVPPKRCALESPGCCWRCSIHNGREPFWRRQSLTLKIYCITAFGIWFFWSSDYAYYHMFIRYLIISALSDGYLSGPMRGLHEPRSMALCFHDRLNVTVPKEDTVKSWRSCNLQNVCILSGFWKETLKNDKLFPAS